MTRAKDISKIVTDADLSGTLDVTGTVTAGGLTLAPSQVINLNSGADSFDDIFRNDSENATIINARNNVRINLDSNSDSTSAEFVIGYNGTNTTTAKALSVGESGDISFYEDTGTTPKLFWDASEEALGIGTTTPSTLIHLERGSTGAGGGSNAGITMTNKFDSPDNSWSITPQRTGVSNTGLQIRDETDSRTDMVFDGSGNVGIGTSSPSDKLHIKDASSTNVIIDAPTDNASLTLQCGSSDAGAEGAFINFIQNTTSKWQVGMNTDNTFRWYNYNTSSEAMRIDSSGNVGIGTSSPAQKLHIDSATNTRLRISTTNTGAVPEIQLYNAVKEWKIGVETSTDGGGGAYSNAGASNFVIRNQTDTTTAMAIDTAGHVTMPYQSAFNVVKTTTQSNIATGSEVTVTFQVELFDQNADFSSNTFTAPVTGRYLLSTRVRLEDVDTAADYYILKIITSNRNWINIMNPDFTGDGDFHSQELTVLADMDAGDTAYVIVNQSSGTAQTDIVGDSSYTYFCGFLAC